MPQAMGRLANQLRFRVQIEEEQSQLSKLLGVPRRIGTKNRASGDLFQERASVVFLFCPVLWLASAAGQAVHAMNYMHGARINCQLESEC